MLMCSNITVYQWLCIRYLSNIDQGLSKPVISWLDPLPVIPQPMIDPLCPGDGWTSSDAESKQCHIKCHCASETGVSATPKEATPRMTWKLEQPWYWSHWSFNFAGNESLLSHTSTGCNCETTSFLINQCLGIRITSARVRSTYFSMHVSRKCPCNLQHRLSDGF